MTTEPTANFVKAVRTHADVVLEDGRDSYGNERTPLLVDAFDARSREAVAYNGRDVADDRRLSNFAFQQEFLRTLVALTQLTGESRYRDAATELVAFAFETLTDSVGLLQWGGHVAYDLDADELVTNKGGPHELKFEYPFYELFWEVDPAATRRFVEAFWSAHVSEWSILDFNRHGGSEGIDDVEADGGDDPSEEPWSHEYEGDDIFFWGDGLTFVNTGSDLYYAAGLLADLDGNDSPLAWAKRLAHRYVETRGETGISGYQFSQHASYCNGPAIRGDRAQYQFAPYIHSDCTIYEGTLFRPRPIVQRQQLVLGDRLGDRGNAFTQWAVEELRAWREAAYRPSDNEFEPVLTDGHSLEGFVIRREGYFGPKGRVIEPIEAGPAFLRTYARAYRETGDKLCWRTAREIAAGLGLGNIGSVGGIDPDLSPETPSPDYQMLYGLLELYRATHRTEYLTAAMEIGQALLDARCGEVFTDSRGRVVLDDPVPLAMLHLAAAICGQDPAELPTPVGDRNTPTGGI